MNEPAHGVTAHQPQQPQNQQYYNYCPQHVILLPDCSGPLPTHSPVSGNLCVSELKLPNGHPVLYALYTLYILDEIDHQILFGCVLGIAAQCDLDALHRNRGMDSTHRAMI